jgi:hypothetical protein
MFTAADAQTHFDRVDVKLSRVPGARFQVRGLGARFQVRLRPLRNLRRFA